MENPQPMESENSMDILTDPQMLNFINQTKNWTKFLSILGFIFIGFMILGGLAMFVMGTAFMSNMNMGNVIPGSFFGVFYILLSIIYLIPTLQLYNCSTHLSYSQQSGSIEEFITAFGKLKSFFKFWGILSIVLIGLYILIFIGVIIGGFSSIM